MLKAVGGFCLACAGIAWLMAFFGAWPVHTGVGVALMCSGIALALTPLWLPIAPVTREAASESEPVSVEPIVPARSIPEPIAPVPAVFGSVPAIMPEVLAPARGKKTEIRRAYEAYALACKRTGARAVPPVEFVPLMQTLCELLRIETQRRGAYVYLMNVTLAK